jgi:head-tail adaptor
MRGVNLTRELVLEELETTPDGAGGTRSGWVALGTLWADVRAGSGREAGGAAQAVSRTRYRIMVRAAPHAAAARPRPDQRLREGDRIWRILSVAETDRAGRYLTCHAEEEVAA